VIFQTHSVFDQPTWLERVSFLYKGPVIFLLGIVLGLSCPAFDVGNINFSWLAWIGLAPLLVLIRGASGKWEAAISGLIFGLGYNSVALSFYLGLAPMTALGLPHWLGTAFSGLIWMLECLHQSLLFGAFALIVFCLPLRAGFIPNIERPFFPYIISVPLIWVFLQWFVAPSEFFIGLPINQLVYSQYRNLPLVQMSAWLGSGCLDYLIVMSNAVIACSVIQCFKLAKKMGRRTDQLTTGFGAFLDLAFIALLVFCLSAWGEGRIARIQDYIDVATVRLQDPQTPPVTVGVVQGNVSAEEERLQVTKPEHVAKRYNALSRNLGVLMLVFPEGVINNAQMLQGNLLSIVKSLCKYQNKEAIVGSIENLQGGELVNAARIISPLNPKDNLYVKQRLVPLGESAPIKALNERIPSSLREHIPASRESFLSTNQVNLVSSMWGKVGLSIFIEMAYPRLIANEVRRGAHLLVNLSNLSWFHESSLNKQLLAASVFRAVENGRYIVMSTNTGISAIIDPSGVISSKSLPGKRGVLIDTVEFFYWKTPYNRMWWL
jgi:apolipoprotein N-acyltransferase